ncbi:MAG: FGGY-family carbohydrate kinase [Acidimicrobiales bacterium]
MASAELASAELASTELLVGLDIGTTMTKAAVVGPNGEEMSWGRVPTPWRAVPSGAEAEPFEMLGAAVGAISDALAAAPPGRVVGLGVTSMAETVVLLGKDGLPVGPSIAWHDSRGEEEAADLARVFGDAAFSQRTGLVASPMCTLVKLAWLSRHNGPPAQRALSVSDWVVHSLGGEQLAEASLASRTGALSLAGRHWWAEGLKWAGAGEDLFPTVVQAGEPAGRATLDFLPRAVGLGRHHPEALERLRGAALTSAGHDHLCVAAGLGAAGPGQILDSCGTAEAFVRTVPALDERGVGNAVQAGLNAGWNTVPGTYALLTGQLLGLMLDRVLALLGVTGRDAVACLDAAAQAVPAGPLRVVQEGFGTPASILGVGATVSPAALWSAALDSLSDGAVRITGAMGAIAGPAEELVLSGGWARCAGLRQRRRALLPSMRWPAVTEAGARGAAMFGGCAAGLFAGPGDFPVPADRPF